MKAFLMTVKHRELDDAKRPRVARVDRLVVIARTAVAAKAVGGFDWPSSVKARESAPANAWPIVQIRPLHGRVVVAGGHHG